MCDHGSNTERWKRAKLPINSAKLTMPFSTSSNRKYSQPAQERLGLVPDSASITICVAISGAVLENRTTSHI